MSGNQENCVNQTHCTWDSSENECKNELTYHHTLRRDTRDFSVYEENNGSDTNYYDYNTLKCI